VRYRVGNKTIEKELWASNERDAKAMAENEAKWENPKKDVQMISIKPTRTHRKKLG